MTRRVRLVLLAIGGAVLLAAAAAVALPLLVDAEALRGPAEARLAAALGRPVHLGRLSFSLATGLALRAEGLRIDPPPGAPESAALAARRVDVRPRLLPLLRRRVVLRSVRAEGVEILRGDRPVLRGGALRARLDLAGADVSAAGTVSGTLVGPGDSPLDLSATVRRAGPVTEVTGLEGTLGGSDLSGSIRAETGERGTVVTFDLSSRQAVLDQLAALAGALPSGEGPPVTGGGRYRAARGTLAGRPVEAVDLQVRLAGNVVHLDPVGFTLHGGRCAGALSVDTSRESLPFRLTGRGEGIDASAFSSALRGRAGATLDLRGRAGEPQVLPTLDGTLAFELRDGAVRSVGVMTQVAALLESAGGGGIGRDETPFTRAGGTLALARGHGRTDDLRVESPDLALTGTGSLDLAGPLDLEVLAAFSPEVSASMVARTPQLRYRLDPSGRLTVPLRVRGTLLSPELKVDTSRMTREILRERFREKKGTLLDRLLSR